MKNLQDSEKVRMGNEVQYDVPAYMIALFIVFGVLTICFTLCTIAFCMMGARRIQNNELMFQIADRGALTASKYSAKTSQKPAVRHRNFAKVAPTVTSRMSKRVSGDSAAQHSPANNKRPKRRIIGDSSRRYRVDPTARTTRYVERHEMESPRQVRRLPKSRSAMRR